MNTTTVNAMNREHLHQTVSEVKTEVRSVAKDMLSLMKIIGFICAYMAVHAYFYVL